MEQKPEPQKPTAIEFVKAKLALNPEASFADIKAQAKVEGIAIYPVVYGRAKALLGLVPTAPYGSKSKARKEAKERAAAAAAAASRDVDNREAEDHSGSTTAVDDATSSRTARARAAARRGSAEPTVSLEGMIDELKTAVRERDRYRAILEKVAALIRAELED